MGFDLGRTLTGLLLGLAGAGVLALYTSVNGRMRGRGARSHWRLGWILGGLGMALMGSGWALLSLAGPRLGGALMRAAGGILCGLALLVYAASARHVGRLRAPGRYNLDLRTEGIYSRVRHPQALALCVLAAGIGLATGSVPYLLTVPLWIAFWTAYTYLEERNELVPFFGEKYLRYRERTPRLCPWKPWRFR